MTTAPTYSSDVAFTPAVKTIQARKGSRGGYAHMEEERDGFRTEIDGALAAFIGEQTSFFLATATADGQPYIQHRGGPAGFIKTRTPWPSRTIAVTGNTSRKATSARIPRRTFS